MKSNIINVKNVIDNDFRFDAKSYLTDDEGRFVVVEEDNKCYLMDRENKNVIATMFMGGLKELQSICDFFNELHFAVVGANHIIEGLVASVDIRDNVINKIKKEKEQYYNILCEISQSIQYGIDKEKLYGDEYTSVVLNDIYDEFKLKDYKKEGLD